MTTADKPYRILMIEDNPADLRLMLEAIRETGLDEIATPSYAYDGFEALDLLEASKNVDTPFHVILLDLNMPKLNGKEILARIKADDAFANIPVMIMTNSDYKRDMIECYNLRADSYLQKPTDFKRLTDFFICVKRSLEMNKRLSVLLVERTYDELSLAV
jgi:two-component system, chemotaxis family, response regulator Rcp1